MKIFQMEQIRKTAESLLNLILSGMTKKDINSVYWRAKMFKPLKQTEYKLGDTPHKTD